MSQAGSRLAAPCWDTATMRSRWVDLDGDTHWLEVDGPAGAPPLVAVHGLGGSHTNWLAVAPGLSRDRRFYALDLAGHGDTKPDHRRTEVEANRLLLDRFLTEVVGEPATLMGNSMGGLISVRQAALNPGSVRDLVLLGPALPIGGHRLPEPLVAAGVAVTGIPNLGSWLLRQRRRRSTPEQQVSEMLQLCCVDPSRVREDVVDEMVAMAYRRLDYAGTELAMEQAARSTVSGVLNRRAYDRMIDRVQAPVLILHGEQDRLVPVQASRRAVARRPDWTLVTRPDLGHVVQLEDPAWTVQQMHGWVPNIA